MIESFLSQLKEIYKFTDDEINDIRNAPEEKQLIFVKFVASLSEMTAKAYESYFERYAERNPEIKKALTQIHAEVRKEVSGNVFSSVLQGTATNTLTKINSRKAKDAIADNLMNVLNIKRDTFTVKIHDYMNNKGLRQSTHQLFDALIAEYTNSGGHSELVNLRFTDYMTMRGLTDEKSARQQVKEDLQTLANLKISFTSRRRGKNAGSYFDLGIVQQSKGIVNGIITVYLDSAFCSMLGTCKPMPYHPLLWQLSENHNPHSFYFLRKISEMKFMNVGKHNEDIIAVLTLLESSPNMPKYDDVMKHPIQQIITPFERDMDALDDALTWEYCHNYGKPLNDDELSVMDYEPFHKLYVKIHWRNYPDMTERIEHKALTAKTAKRRTRRRLSNGQQ